jgi:DNA-binding MarR family transcriptional regulator
MIENFRIRVFRAVAHHLSFSRAAEEVLLLQPAVTQQIKALEDDVLTARQRSKSNQWRRIKRR